MARIIDLTKDKVTPSTKLRKSIKTSAKEKLEKLKMKVSELNAEKMDLLLKNEELSHELYILRRKYRQLIEHY